MNQLDIPEMIELLKKDENADMRRQLAELILLTIEEDSSLKAKIAEIVNKEQGRRIKSSGY